MEILENIPVTLDLGEIRRRLHMEGRGDWNQIHILIDSVKPFLQARAAYKVSFIEAKLEHAVIIDGRRLASQVLRKHLDKVERVFPYVVTIGNELEEMASACNDLLEQFYLDAIGNVGLASARKYLEDQLRSRFALGEMSYMAPGSLADWPIEEQKLLFSILGDVKTAIGVALSGSLLMIPKKSVSGIYFPTETKIFSCQLCPRDACPSRKAGYDEKLAREYGIFIGTA